MYNFFEFFASEPVMLFSKPNRRMRIVLETLSAKLLNHHFSHIEFEEPFNIEAGATLQVFYQNKCLGTAKVAAVRYLPFTRLSNLVTLIDSNMTVQQYAALITRRHGPVNADQEVAHAVLQWESCEQHLIHSLLNAAA